MTSVSAPPSADIALGLARVSMPRLFGFSMGAIGDRIFRDAPAFLLLLYMTDSLAIPAAMAGLALFLPKLLIIFVDPTIGMISDRLDTRWGRRRPLMLLGAFLSGLAILLFFNVPAFDKASTRAIYVSVVVFLGFSGFSLYSVPYLTMASELADNDHERRRVMSWRVMFMGAGLFIGAFAGGVVEALGGGARGFSTMAWIYAAACTATMLASVAATGDTPIARGDKNALSLAGQLRFIITRGRYLRVLMVGFLQKLAEGVGTAAAAYFCVYVVNQPLSSVGLVMVGATASQILTQSLWLKASARWSPATVYAIAVGFWCFNLACWLGMRGQPHIMFLALGVGAGIAAGGVLMVTLSLLSTTIAAEAAETGVNRDGVYTGFWLAAEKLAFALGALLVGVFIGAFGFIEHADGVVVQQPASAIVGIAIAYCGLNGAAALLSLFALYRSQRHERRPTVASAGAAA